MYNIFTAYKVHSAIGAHCVGAKVNGKQVTIKHLLRNGDSVEVFTQNCQNPKREWLRYCRSSKAKSRIRSYLKRLQRENSISVGKTMIEKGLKQYGGEVAGKKEYQRKMGHLLTTFSLKDENALFTALGYGQITLDSVMENVFGSAVVKTRGRQCKGEKDDQFVLSAKRSAHQGTSNQPTKTGIIVGQEKNILLNFCKSCNPLMGENIKGVVSQGLGVKVHRLGCRYLLEADGERIVDVHWDDRATEIKPRPVRIQVICEDNPGVLANMSRAITSLGINIGNVSLRKLSSGKGLARLEVMVGKLEELEKVITHLMNEEGILSVSRK